MTRRIAVTGASGFIGRHLTKALAARDDLVTSVARPFDIDVLTGVFRKTDTVVHLAGVVSAVREQDFYAANVEATRRVAEAARAAGARLIHISSLAAAGPAPAVHPRSEEDPPSPITPYGRSKLQGERIVTGMPGLRWTVLRPGVVYGPGDRAMQPLFRFAERGILPLVGHPSAAYMFIHIDDLVRAVTAAIDRDLSGEVIFLGHPRPVTASELLEAIRGALGHATEGRQAEERQGEERHAEGRRAAAHGAAGRRAARRRVVIVPVPLVLARLAATIGDLAGWMTGRPSAINRWRYAELASEGFVCRVDRMRQQLSFEPRIPIAEGIAMTARQR